MRRTITPAKYTALTAYSTTGGRQRDSRQTQRHSALDLKENGRTEHTLVTDVSDAEPEACWEGAHQDVEIKEERNPGGGLMLRYRRDDGNVNLGVAAQKKHPKMTSNSEYK